MIDHYRTIKAATLSQRAEAREQEEKRWRWEDYIFQTFQVAIAVVCVGSAIWVSKGNATPAPQPTSSLTAKRGGAADPYRSVDLTANFPDAIQVLRIDRASSDFSVEPGSDSGASADWWVIRQGPKGWFSWNGKAWTPGLHPWHTRTAPTDLPGRTMVKSRVTPGHYTYWVCVYPADGSQDSQGAPIYVTKR